MPKLAANLTMTFGEVEFLDRFEAAADAGFRGVEYLFPYAYDAKVLKERLRANGLTQVLHNLPAGNWAAGERGIACHPDRVEEFKTGVDQAIAYANTLGCDRVNCLAGIPPAGVDPAAARDTLVRNNRDRRDGSAQATGNCGQQRSNFNGRWGGYNGNGSPCDTSSTTSRETDCRRGGMAEWSMAVVLKTIEPETVPGVRIPLPPPTSLPLR